MSQYAAETSVSPERSRMEIEAALTRYKADQFMYGWREASAMIAFRAKGRHVRFLLPMPNREDTRFLTDRRGRLRSPDAAEREYQQAIRQRWRALALCIKAKLEAVESGISEFEDEFMAQIVLPNGETMSEHARPLIARAYESGKMPPLLPHFGD